MNPEEFEILLSVCTDILQNEARSKPFKSSIEFESRVRHVIQDISSKNNLDVSIDFNSHVQAFPDICIGKYGIEVKFTEKDTWKGIANSINQGMKQKEVKETFVLWCKQGGVPEIRYRPYEDVVVHLRTSHVPRFEIDMEAVDSLFSQFQITYPEFSELPMAQKMKFVREYVRNRRRSGSSVEYWFLETQKVDGDGAPRFRLFDTLPIEDRVDIALREVILFPEVLAAERATSRFDARVNYLLNEYDLLYPQRFSLYIEFIEKQQISPFVWIRNHEVQIQTLITQLSLQDLRLHAKWWKQSSDDPFADWKKYLHELMN